MILCDHEHYERARFAAGLRDSDFPPGHWRGVWRAVCELKDTGKPLHDTFIIEHVPNLEISWLAQRMALHGWTTPGYPQEGADHESEEGQEALLRNGARPSSESEAGPKPAPDGSLRIPKEDRTVRNDRITLLSG